MVKCVRIVARHFQATALEGALGSERGDDHVAAGLDCVSDRPNVCCSRGDIGQEMKHRAVVPHIDGCRLEGECRDVPAQPVDLARRGAKSRSRHRQRGFGDVEHGKIGIAQRQPVIDQCCLTGADIDDAGGALGNGRPDELERDVEVRAIPAHLRRLRGRVDLLPV